MTLTSSMVFALVVGAPPAPDGVSEPVTPVPITGPRSAIPERRGADVLAAPTDTVGNLGAAIDIARATSPVLGAANADLSIARARRRQVLGGLLPTLSAVGQTDTALIRGIQRGEEEEILDLGPAGQLVFPATEDQILPDPATYLQGSLSLGVPLLAADRWASMASARTTADASSFDRDEANRVTTLLLALAMIDAARQQEAASASRDSLIAVTKVADLTQRRMEMGAAINLDVVRAEQEIQLAHQQIVLADETTRRARESLGIVLGRNGQWGVDAHYVVDALLPDVAARCKHVGTDGRPDTRAAETRVAAAKRGLTASRMSWVPTLSATGTYIGANVAGGANGLKQSLTVGGVLSWPLYDGGIRYGQIRESKALVERSDWQAQDVRRRAALEGVQSDRGVTVARRQLELTEDALGLAERAVELSQRAFERGDARSLDMLDALRRLRLAQLDLAIRRYDLVAAQVRATIAQGQCRV